MTSSPTSSFAALATSTAAYLDKMFSDYPILVLEDFRLIAGYAKVDLEIRVAPGRPGVKRSRGSPNRFVASSLFEALAFVGAVEEVRQRSRVPYIQIQTGHGPSSTAKRACICRTAKACAGAGR